MDETIKVHVVDRGRKFLYLRYFDPMTGKPVERSSGCKSKKEAQKEAGKWEDELRDGRYKPRSRITWAEFRQRYEDEVLPGLKRTTDVKVSGVFEAVERILAPEKLSSVTAERISHLVKVLRSEQMTVEVKVKITGDNGRKRVEKRKTVKTVVRSESTIRGHLATLKAALNWASEQKMLNEVPAIKMPKRAKGQKVMKGRPITGEEFDRFLIKVPEAPCVKPEDIEDIRRFLRGLWWGGLRLEEAVDLWWDREDRMHVDLSGDEPVLRIHGDQEKGGQDRVLAIAPEFAEILLAVPQQERVGRVFRLPSTRKDNVSKIVSAIGKAAGIKVNTDPRTGKVKYASAHDLRRSFGERWAARVMPQILMELMRHESIETTMRYYVGRNAQNVAKVLREAVAKSDISGDTQAPAAIPVDVNP